MSDQWYYRLLDQEFGPVTRDALNAMIARGELSADAPIRTRETSTWSNIRDVIPEMFMNGHASHHDSAKRYATKEHGSVMSLESLSDAGLGEAGTNGAGLNATISNGSSESMKSAPPANNGWYYQSNGKELGPVSFEQLIELAKQGQLLPENQIRMGAEGKWRRAGSAGRLLAVMPIQHQWQSSPQNLSSSQEDDELELSVPFKDAPSKDTAPAPSAKAPVAATSAPVPSASQTPKPSPTTTPGLTPPQPQSGVQTQPASQPVVAQQNQPPTPAQQPVTPQTPPRPQATVQPQPQVQPQLQQFQPQFQPQFPQQMASPMMTPPQGYPQFHAGYMQPSPQWGYPQQMPMVDQGWYAWLGGVEYGPMEFSQLAGLAQGGRITAQDYVKQGRYSQWSVANTIPNLLPAAPQAAAQKTATTSTEKPAAKSSTETSEKKKDPATTSASATSAPTKPTEPPKTAPAEKPPEKPPVSDLGSSSSVMSTYGSGKGPSASMKGRPGKGADKKSSSKKRKKRGGKGEPFNLTEFVKNPMFMKVFGGVTLFLLICVGWFLMPEGNGKLISAYREYEKIYKEIESKAGSNPAGNEWTEFGKSIKAKSTKISDSYRDSSNSNKTVINDVRNKINAAAGVKSIKDVPEKLEEAKKKLEDAKKKLGL